MKDFVVWLDSKSATVFELGNSGIEKSVLKTLGLFEEALKRLAENNLKISK